MRISKSLSVLILSALAVAGIRAYPQASITENQTTYVYVNASTGSDSHTGSSTSPLRTIQAAVNKANANNQKKIGTKIIVASGVYRESVSVNHGSTTVPLTIQAASTGGAVIAGSDVLSGWTPVSGHPYTYYHSWNYNFGNCAIPSGWPIEFSAHCTPHRDDLCKQGCVYAGSGGISAARRHVLRRRGTNQILVTTPSRRTFTADGGSRGAELEPFTVNSRTNLVLRGLVFRHASTCINQSAADINGSSERLN